MPATTTRSAVLFLVFNRPDTTARVFASIRDARPPRLYVAADGPRPARPEEAEQCRLTREAAGPVDWPCEVKTLFRERNLGCKEAVASALDWFFSQEEEGIILEDDCLPAPCFFGFCDTLLARYRHDDRIRHITGSNLQFGTRRGDASYYFSRLTHVWGWASWRRVWRDYDKELARVTPSQFHEALMTFFNEPLVADHWQKTVAELRAGKIDTWDYQLAFTNLLNNGLSIIPNENLISNIGFRPDATHTTDAATEYANLPLGHLDEIRHPPHFVPDRHADLFTLNRDFRLDDVRREIARRERKYRRLKYRIKRWIAAHGGPRKWENAGK